MDNNQILSSNRIILGISVLSFAAIAASYWPTLYVMHVSWTRYNEAYSHGYLVAAIVIYAIVKESLQLGFVEKRPYSSILFAFVISIGWVAGYATQVQLLQQVLLPAIIGVWLLSVFGWQQIIRYVPPLLFIYLVIPLWGGLTDPLRQMTVNVVQFGLNFLDIPALIEGYRVTLPSGIMVVADGCSGLNYLLVSMVIGAYFAFTSLSLWQHRLLIVLLAIVIALVGNWTRVFLLVLVGHYSEMQHPLIHDHGFFGWLVFGCFLVGFFVIGSILIRKTPDREISAGNFGREDAKNRSIENGRNSRTTVVSITLVTVALVAAPLWARTISSTVHLDRDGEMSIPGFAVSPANTTAGFWLPKYKGFDEIVFATSRTHQRSYELVVVIYRQQTQGKELVYYENKLADEHVVKHLPKLTIDSGLSFNQSVVKAATGARLVWWGYKVGDNYTTSPLLAKALQLSALLAGKPKASLIALSTACTSIGCADELSPTSIDNIHLLQLQHVATGLHLD